MKTLDKMRLGEKITIEEKLELRDMYHRNLALARERGMFSWEMRILEGLEALENYRPRRLRPRKMHEISADIEHAADLAICYENQRKYILAASWRHNRDEYEREFRHATDGEAYAPRIIEEIAAYRAQYNAERGVQVDMEELVNV